MLNKINSLLMSSSYFSPTISISTYSARQSADTFTLPAGIKDGDVGILISAARFNRGSSTALISNGTPTQTTPGTNVWTQQYAVTSRSGNNLNGAAASGFHKRMTAADSSSVVSNLYGNNSAESGYQILIIISPVASLINGYNIFWSNAYAGSTASTISPSGTASLITPGRHFLFAALTGGSSGSTFDSNVTTAGVYLYADQNTSFAPTNFEGIVENFNRDKYSTISALSSVNQTFYCDQANVQQGAVGGIGVEIW